MPTVEGFTPDVAWTTLYGIIALGLLFLIGYRVYDAIHTIQDRRRQQRQAEKPDFAEEVSRKVLLSFSRSDELATLYHLSLFLSKEDL